MRPVLALFAKVDRFVDRNPVNSGVETRSAFERVQGLKGLNECVCVA